MNEEMKGIDRRSFLAGAGMLAAAGVVGSAAGCSSTPNDGGGASTADTDAGSTSAAGGTPVSVGNPDRIGELREASATEEADVVVVGSGMAGMCAAIFVAEQAPDAKVILLEKLAGLGGNTNFAEGGAGGEGSTGIEARRAAWKYVQARDYVPSSMLYHAREITMGDDSAWLFGKHGVKLNANGTMYEGDTGASAIKILDPQAEELGVDIRTNARAIALVTSDAYTVTGIQYLDNDTDCVQINCKAVVMCTAGMGNNPELLNLYTEPDTSKIPAVGQGQDGEGQLMVEKTAHGHAGYQVLDAFFLSIGTLEEPSDYHSDLGLAAGMQPTIFLVNDYGVRYMPESGPNTDMMTGRPMAMLSQGRSYTIFDAGYVERWENGEWTFGAWGAQNAEVGRPLEIQKDLEAYANCKWFYKADTVRELGELLKIDNPQFGVDAFEQEVAAYTQYAENGVDELYGKDAAAMWPLGKAPYYAAQTCLFAYATHGGIRVNTDAQATDPQGKVIKGLYAAGACMGTLEGMTYKGGTGQSFCLFGGLASGRHIVTNVLGGSVDPNWMGDVRYGDLYEVREGEYLDSISPL